MYKQLFGFALLLLIAKFYVAITEDPEEVKLRDASFSRERSSLYYDMFDYTNPKTSKL